MDTELLQQRMGVVAAATQQCVYAGVEAGMTTDAALAAALIGLVSLARIHGCPEEALWKTAREAVPVRAFYDLTTRIM